jgi:hypothetical protein
MICFKTEIKSVVREGKLHESQSDDNDGISRPAAKFAQKDVTGRPQFAELQRAFQKLVALSQKYANGECNESEWRSAVDEVTEVLQKSRAYAHAKNVPNTSD